jgi:predicted MPP superfamily phosphohydrolase
MLPPLWPIVLGTPAALLGIAGILYGTLYERHNLRLHQVTVDVPGLPDAYDGYRITQLSDFHAGGRGWSSDTARRAVEMAMAQPSDLIVLTGDYCERLAALPVLHEILKPLCAPDGVLAVLGNHDYADRVVRLGQLIETMRSLAIHVLRNEAVRLVRGGAELWVVGVDDPYSGHDYLPRALAGVPSVAHPIMLVHYPDFVWRLPPDRYALVLAGHAHGTQVNLPLIGWYARRHIALTRFSAGLYDVNHTPMFVTSGVGTSGRPIRLRARPEIARICLRARVGSRTS